MGLGFVLVKIFDNLYRTNQTIQTFTVNLRCDILMNFDGFGNQTPT